MAHSLIFDKALNRKQTFEHEGFSKEDFATIAEIDEGESPTKLIDTSKFNYKFLKHLVTKPEKTQAECKHLADQLRFFNFPKLIKESIEGFNEEKLLELVKCLKVERLPTNTPLWQENEYCNARMYLILSGEVTLTKKKEDPISKMIISARPSNMSLPKNDRSLSPKKKSTMKEAPILKQHHSLMRTNSFKRVQLDFVKIKINDNKGGLEALTAQMPNLTSSLSPGKYEIDIDSVDNSSEEGLSPTTKRMMYLKKISLQGRNADHYQVTRKLPGEFIGEEIITGQNKRKMTVFVSAPSELILLKVEDIRHTENIFENKIIEVYNFLKEVLPSAEKLDYSDVKRNIIPYIQEKKIDKGAILSEEGDISNYFYILKEGECQCFKKYVTDLENQKTFEFGLEGMFTTEKKIEMVSLYNMNRPCLIAEEILFNEDGRYEFSVKVVSQYAILYQIERKSYFSHFPEEVIKGMKRLSKNKKLSNKRLIKEKLYLLEETFPKKQILASEIVSTQGSEQYLSPRYLQTQTSSRRKMISPRYPTNENILEVQTYHSPAAHPYLAALGTDILTLSDKFREYSHMKWNSKMSALRNASNDPHKNTADLLVQDLQNMATETKETREMKRMNSVETKENMEESDGKHLDRISRNLKETLEKEKFFPDKQSKSKHTRSYSNNISIPSSLKSPRVDSSPQTTHAPKVSNQLSLIQSQTEKLIANPKILTTFFSDKKQMESPFAQSVKIFPKKPNPLEQLKNYLLDSKVKLIKKKEEKKEIQRPESQLGPANLSSLFNNTNSFNHSARKLNLIHRKPLRVNVVQGTFY